jgi:DNA-directed RNA polymerase subunit M/transcription elongation factor TFIIS
VDASQPSAPQYIGVDCRVCQTRLYGLPEHVGKRLKCPDCGALTVLPPPPKAKPANRPAALDQEQYELWGPDEQPLPSELLKAQPKYIAVACRLCETLMQATEDQVGQVLVCPDCRTQNVVPPLPKSRREKKPVDKSTYEVDATRDPGERPLPIPPPTRALLYEQEEAAEEAREAAKPKHKRRTDVRGRPIMPRWPLVTGVVPFLFAPGTPMRWFGLSFALMLSGGMLVDAIAHWMSWTPKAYDFEGGMIALAGLVEMLFGVVFTLLWSAYASGVFVAVVSESSEGRDRVYNWPKVNFIESMADLAYVYIAMMFSVAPGWIIGFFAFPQPEARLLGAMASLTLFFPIVFLSQLAANSPWAVLGGQVFAGLARRPFSCLVFYLESVLLAGLCAAAVYVTAPLHHVIPVLFAPLFVAAGLLYARLLGRLAWRISESLEGKKTDAGDA